MKNDVLRKSFPRVREIKKDGVTRYVCDSRRRGFNGKQEWFSTSSEALDRAREIADSLNKGNVLTDDERWTFLRYRDAFTPYGTTVGAVLEKALYRLQNKAERDEEEKRTVAALVDLWIEDKKSGKFKKIREVTIREIEQTGKKIKELWGTLQIQSVTKEHVSEFIGNHPVGYSTKRGYRIKIGGFFNWCNANGYSRGNPAKYISIGVEETTPQTVPLEEVKKLLEISQKNPRFLPLIKYLVLGFFGGLRPYEIRRLPQSHINMKTRQIYISRDITKTKTERYVAINDNLFAFLERYHEQPVHHPNFIKLFSGLRQKVGYGLNGLEGKAWVVDGIRHTFGSMWLARTPNINALAEEMGNSAEVIRKHYKKAIPAEELAEFWKIMPLEKVAE